MTYTNVRHNEAMKLSTHGHSSHSVNIVVYCSSQLGNLIEICYLTFNIRLAKNKKKCSLGGCHGFWHLDGLVNDFLK